jgi:hypothetical protein
MHGSRRLHHPSEHGAMRQPGHRCVPLSTLRQALAGVYPSATASCLLPFCYRSPGFVVGLPTVHPLFNYTWEQAKEVMHQAGPTSEPLTTLRITDNTEGRFSALIALSASVILTACNARRAWPAVVR